MAIADGCGVDASGVAGRGVVVVARRHQQQNNREEGSSDRDDALLSKDGQHDHFAPLQEEEEGSKPQRTVSKRQSQSHIMRSPAALRRIPLGLMGGCAPLQNL
jgi:hypothetical protein